MPSSPQEPDGIGTHSLEKVVSRQGFGRPHQCAAVGRGGSSANGITP